MCTRAHVCMTINLLKSIAKILHTEVKGEILNTVIYCLTKATAKTM